MLQASRDYLTPDHTILDGASIKGPLITTYRELDNLQISVASTHLGAVPEQPWRGIKVWVCEVGPHSERAKRLAFNLFLSTNSSIQTIDINEHRNVERDQWLTMATAHIFAAALRNAGFPLGAFDSYATLNAELQALPIGRTLGQGTKIPSEVIAGQPLKEEYMETLREGLRELESVLGDRDGLQAWMQQNIDFHNGDGTVNHLFKKAGVIGARNANLRMHSFSFRITNDQPGILSSILEPFHAEGANLTAIDSMPGTATDKELERGVDPDKIVDFDIGVDPKTIDPDKEERIKEQLVALGCVIS
jgi:prephenate dehydrogenase